MRVTVIQKNITAKVYAVTSFLIIYRINKKYRPAKTSLSLKIFSLLRKDRLLRIQYSFNLDILYDPDKVTIVLLVL